jgi:hypothetical protein
VGHVPERARRRAGKKLRAAARALYAKGPSDAELASFGLLASDLDDTAVEVWPDNFPAVNALIAMDTQWRIGAAGPTGLDYNVMPSVFRFLAIPRQEWPDTFDCVRVLEAEALATMSEGRK